MQPEILAEIASIEKKCAAHWERENARLAKENKVLSILVSKACAAGYLNWDEVIEALK